MGGRVFALRQFADTPSLRGKYLVAPIGGGQAVYVTWLGPVKQRIPGAREQAATVLWVSGNRVVNSSFAPACAKSCEAVVAPVAVDTAVLVRPADAAALRIGDRIRLAAGS